MTSESLLIRRSKPRRKGWLALSPFLVLVALMVAMSCVIGDFSKLPMTLVFLLTSVYALSTLRGYSMAERVQCFSQGAGHSDLLLMVWIFILAGAFASSAKQMGAVTATVDLTLQALPSSLILASLFLSSCIVSICIGTSVGTIVALVPIASEMALRTGNVTALMVAAVVGGAFLGDNLSFISDTTIAATRTQGCSMCDKFRTNFRIVLPAALLCFLLYVVIGLNSEAVSIARPQHFHWLRIVPYIGVLITTFMGINVLIVLLFGILLTGIIGIAEGSYTLVGWFASVTEGITGMGNLILISMMAGGLLAVVRKGGGMTYLVRALTKRVHSKRGAECCISALVVLANCCTANNTVAILSVGSIARDISQRYGIDSKRTASLLDIFSCIIQGLIPYGAQLLMASGLAAISSLEIIPFLFYSFLLILTVSVSIALVGRK